MSTKLAFIVLGFLAVMAGSFWAGMYWDRTYYRPVRGYTAQEEAAVRIQSTLATAGTVVAKNASSMVVETADGSRVTLMLSPETQIYLAPVRKTLDDVVVGSEVVVGGSRGGGDFEGGSIQIKSSSR